MIKNLTTNQLILIALAAALLLVASFSFYLLQNPTAPLPFAPPPATSISTPSTQTMAETAIPNTPTPTRRTSYTPLFAFVTPTISTTAEPPTAVASPGTGTPAATFAPPTAQPYPPPGTPVFTGTPSSGTSVFTGTPSSGTTVFTATPPSRTVTTSPTTSSSPTATSTLAAGEIRVTGRLIQNGTPKPNVIVSFADDTAPRQSVTDGGGHYSFISLAPGTNFTLTFKQSDNPGLTPTTEIASLGWIEGTLPTGVNPIDFPDLEVSINLNGMLFELLTPVDGAAFSAAAINDANPIQFSWSLYSQGGSYSIELGPNGVNQPTWVSSQLASTSFMWNGTLTDGAHIAAGNYWWRVGVKKSLGNYILKIYTQPFDLSFNP